MQSKGHSLLEAVLNTSIGYVIAILTQVAVFPLFGIHIPLEQDLLIGLIFTVVSLVRSYALRRLFNRWHLKGS